MSRSHWIAFGACPAVLAFIVAACGGSSDPEDTNNATDSGTVTDTGTTTPVGDTGTGTPVDAGADTGTQVDVPVDPNAAGGVSETSLNFGTVDCNTAAPAKTFAITNPSTTGSLIFSASLVKGIDSPFTMSPTDGKIGPSQRALITITPNQIPRGAANQPTSTASNGQGDRITIVAGTSTDLSVDLLQTARGAVLSFNPGSIDFKNSPLAAGTVASGFGVQNDGNVAANLALTSTGAAFGLGTSGNVTTTGMLTANANALSTSSVAFTPSTAAPFTGSIGVALVGTTPLCADLPSALTLDGVGVNGAVGLSAPSLLFGTTDCGATAQPKQVTLTNFGGVSLKITSLTFTKGGSYYTASSSPGLNTNIAPNQGMATITVTPRQIAVGASASTDDHFYDGTLAIATQDANGNNVTVTLDLVQNARGVIITRTPTAGVAFGNIGRGNVGKQKATYANTGNVDVTFNVTHPSTLFGTPATVAVGKGQSTDVNLTFTPDTAATANTNYSDTLTFTRADLTVPLCNAVATTPLSGTGVAPVSTVSPTSIDFGQNGCGTTAEARHLIYTNNGPQIAWTAVLRKTDASQFTLSAASGTTLPGGTVDLVVTPKAVPTNNVNMNAITDVIDFTPGSGEPLVATSLSITPQGAFIQWQNGATPSGAIGLTQALPNAKVSTGTTTTVTNAFKNTGTVNLTANFQFTLSNASPYITTTAATTGDLAQNTTSPQFVTTFKPLMTGTYTALLTATSLTAGVPICNTQQTLTFSGIGN